MTPSELTTSLEGQSGHALAPVRGRTGCGARIRRRIESLRPTNQFLKRLWQLAISPYWVLPAVMLSSGCTRSVPSYLNESGAISSYLDRATKVDYPDVVLPSLDEVTQAQSPITVVDPDFNSYYDLTLEDAISYGLNNAKVLRGYGTPAFQNSRVIPGVDNIINSPNAAGTMWNVAVRETEPGFIGVAGQLGNPGGLLTNTGLDVNQGVESALADFDAYLASSMNLVKSDEPRNTTPTNPLSPLVFVQDQLTWQSEVGKKTASGTQVLFRNANTYLDNNNPLVPEGFQELDSWYRTSFEAEFRQPLLRGRGEFINRMPIIVSRIGADQEIALLETQLQNFVANIEIRYWDLYLAYRNLDAAKEGRDAALETWKIVDDQFREGAEVNVQQVAQAAQQYFAFNSQVTEAFNQVLNAQGQLRFLIGWSSTDGTILRPVDEPAMAQIEFSWCESLCEALTYRPELRQERWEIKKRELALAYAKNGLLPELNATALYRWLGLGNRFGTSGDSGRFPDPTSGALNELFDGNYQELSMGLDFRMPIGYRRELANVRNAQVKLAREIGRLEDMELDASRELTEAFQALALNQQVLQQAWDRWRFVKVEEEHFRLLQDAGVQKLDVALDAQQRLAQAEVQFYTSLAEYNKAIALIHRRKGTTLAYSGIEFSEGPWSGKAYLDAREHARRRAASRQVNYGWTRPQVISQGEQSTPSGNVGYPFDSRTVPQAAGQAVTRENLAPGAIQEIETEQVPAREAPNYDSMPTPSEKTRFRNQPTPAVRQTSQFLGHPAHDDGQSTVANVSYEQRIDGNQDPESGNADRQRPLVTSNDSVSQLTEPRRHIAGAQIASLNESQRPSQTKNNNIARSQMANESPVVLNTFAPESSTSSEEPRVDWDRLERLGLERQSIEGSGNIARIQIRN